MKTSRIITIMLLSVALVLTAFSTAFAVSVQADGASGEPLSGLKNSILVDTKLKTSSYLDTVSSKGANVSYFATESSFTQIYGQTGSGISSGAITPVIPVDAISFGCIPESIIGTDDRVKVNNTTVYPYRTSTFLLIKFPNSPYSYLGSGHLISPDTVLTAGHCVYDQALGGWATVEVYPGYNGTTAPYGVAYSTEIYSVSGWINNRSPEHDIAAIKLDRPIGEQTGWLGLTDMTSGAITITGYPGEFQRQMYTMSGTIASVTTNNTFYTIDTTGGNSGSGVYNNNNQIVAVHAYGGATQNSGTRINSEKLSIVNTWIGNGRDNHLPRGAFESATNANSSIISSWRIIGASNKVRVTGWAIDDDIPSASIGIHVYIGGAKGAPGAEFHNIGLANLNRPDIGAANPGSGNFHGFSTDIITCKGGTQTVYVYAVNIDSNGNVRGDSVLIGSKTVNLPLIIQLVDRRIITLPYWRYIHIHYAQQVLKIKKPFPWPDPPPVYRLEPSTLYKFEAIIITDKNARPFFAFEIDDGFELYPVDTEIEKALTESGVKFSPNEKYLQMATVETDINGDMILSIENELKFQEQVSSKSQRFITIEREMNFKEQIANKFQK